MSQLQQAFKQQSVVEKPYIDHNMFEMQLKQQQQQHEAEMKRLQELQESQMSQLQQAFKQQNNIDSSELVTPGRGARQNFSTSFRQTGWPNDVATDNSQPQSVTRKESSMAYATPANFTDSLYKLLGKYHLQHICEDLSKIGVRVESDLVELTEKDLDEIKMTRFDRKRMVAACHQVRHSLGNENVQSFRSTTSRVSARDHFAEAIIFLRCAVVADQSGRMGNETAVAEAALLYHEGINRIQAAMADSDVPIQNKQALGLKMLEAQNRLQTLCNGHLSLRELLAASVDEFGLLQLQRMESSGSFGWPTSTEELSGTAALAVRLATVKSTRHILIPNSATNPGPESSGHAEMVHNAEKINSETPFHAESTSPSDRIRRAVTMSLIKEFDTNGDGTLNKDELEQLVASGVLASPLPSTQNFDSMLQQRPTPLETKTNSSSSSSTSSSTSFIFRDHKSF